MPGCGTPCGAPVTELLNDVGAVAAVLAAAAVVATATTVATTTQQS